MLRSREFVTECKRVVISIGIHHKYYPTNVAIRTPLPLVEQHVSFSDRLYTLILFR
jgi:hypothetical protein